MLLGINVTERDFEWRPPSAQQFCIYYQQPELFLRGFPYRKGV